MDLSHTKQSSFIKKKIEANILTYSYAKRVTGSQFRTQMSRKRFLFYFPQRAVIEIG